MSLLKPWAEKFQNIIITGMPGSGKSLFAKLYAHFSGRSFLDFEDFFEKQTKKTIQEAYHEHGEEGFHRLETRELRKLDQRKQCVIATGSGTLLSPDNFQFACKLGLVVYLKTDPKCLANRIFKDQSNHHSRIRPLFENDISEETILNKVKEMLDKHEYIYEKADIVLPTDLSSLDNLILQLAAIEQKAHKPDYMRFVNSIMRKQSKQNDVNVEE